MGANIEENMENFLKGLVKTAEESGFDDFYLYSELLNGEFILETFFETFFEKVEGRAFSSDKASYVISKIKESIKLKQDLNLQITYGEYQEKGGNIGKITELDKVCYWCPKTISNTKDAFSLFFNFITLSNLVDINKIKPFNLSSDLSTELQEKTEQEQYDEKIN